MSTEHKKSFLAFVVLAMIAATVMGTQFRAQARDSRLLGAGPISVGPSVTQGTLPVRAIEPEPAPAPAPAPTVRSTRVLATDVHEAARTECLGIAPVTTRSGRNLAAPPQRKSRLDGRGSDTAGPTDGQGPWRGLRARCR